MSGIVVGTNEFIEHGTKTVEPVQICPLKDLLPPLDKINILDISVSSNTEETVASSMSFYFSILQKMSRQTPLCQFNVLLCENT